MESKDSKIVIIVACLSLAMVVSSYILGNSLKEGLQSNASSISSAGNQMANSINNIANSHVKQQPDSDILNESQAAVYLQITPSQLTYLLINSKEIDGKGIPHIEVGYTKLFSKTALTKWLSTVSENSFAY